MRPFLPEYSPNGTSLLSLLSHFPSLFVTKYFLLHTTPTFSLMPIILMTLQFPLISLTISTDINSFVVFRPVLDINLKNKSLKCRQGNKLHTQMCTGSHYVTQLAQAGFKSSIKGRSRPCGSHTHN